MKLEKGDRVKLNTPFRVAVGESDIEPFVGTVQRRNSYMLPTHVSVKFDDNTTSTVHVDNLTKI